MKMVTLSGLGLILMMARAVQLASAQQLPILNIDNSAITVSGVSSGGAMAIQMHVAYSSLINGAAIFAAPPYWCAEADVEVALSSCTTKPALIDVQALVDATEYARTIESIDDPKNLRGDRVWIFTGREDTIVLQGVVNKTLDYYSKFVDRTDILYIGSFNSEHSWVTDSYGNNCSYLGSPYINNCGFDGAGSLLNHLYMGNLSPRVVNTSGTLALFDQKLYTPDFVFPHELSMGDSGYIYLPQPCMRNESCRLHVAFHGCNQGLETISNVFVMQSGLNQWADSNNIVVLYPQARKSPDVPYNPQGCWDWWGYTGLDYAVKIAPQLLSTRNMIMRIANLK